METFYEVCDTTFELAKLSLGSSSGGIVDDLTRMVLPSVLQIKGLLKSNLVLPHGHLVTEIHHNFNH